MLQQLLPQQPLVHSNQLKIPISHSTPVTKALKPLVKACLARMAGLEQAEVELRRAQPMHQIRRV
jgi:hypothetical protein